MRLFSFLRFLALLLTPVAVARAQTVINSVPYTISQSGQYQLGTNLAVANASQVAINITAPNVVLDLKGFYVSGPGGTTSSTVAVIQVGDVSNVIIRNGTVANNGYGILYTGGVTNCINHLVEKVNLTRCYLAGISFTNASPGTVIRSCTLSQMGNSTFAVNQDAAGINAAGGVRIARNVVSGVTATGSGHSFGIYSRAGTDFAVGNVVSNSFYGVFGGKYLDNLTNGCTAPFTGGTNATGNN